MTGPTLALPAAAGNQYTIDLIEGVDEPDDQLVVLVHRDCDPYGPRIVAETKLPDTASLSSYVEAMLEHEQAHARARAAQGTDRPIMEA